MNEFQKDYLLKRQDYGVLYPYVMEETVTDIHWNGRQLWIDDLKRGGIWHRKFYLSHLQIGFPCYYRIYQIRHLTGIIRLWKWKRKNFVSVWCIQVLRIPGFRFH